MQPVRGLIARLIESRYGSSVNHVGNRPVSWLELMKKWLRLFMLANSSGIEPFSRFIDSPKNHRFVRFPNVAGSWPESSLDLRSSLLRFSSLPRDAGSVPASLLPWSSRLRRFDNLPIESGNRPES